MYYGDGTEWERLELAMEAAGVAWWWMDLPSGAVFFSPNKALMLGYDPNKFLHYKDFTALVHKNDYEQMMQAMKDHIDGKASTYTFVYRIKAADGKYHKFKDKGRIVSRTPDGDIAVAGLVMDIDGNDSLSTSLDK